MAMESRVTPIAVIGMGCRLPGGIDSPDVFWQALLRGDDLITERTIDTHVKRIRKKFRDAAGHDPVETVHGLGYKLRA